MLPHEFLWEVLFFTGRLIKTVLVVWTYPTWYLVLFISSLVALILYQCFTDATRSNEARDRAGKLGPPRLGLLSLINSRPGPVTPSDLASALNPIGENLIGVCAPYDKIALLRSIRIFGDAFGEADLKDLAKSVQCVQLKHGQMLCTIGEPDDSIYILESGQLHVSCADDVRSAPSAVRIVRVPGESIYSVVSVVEYLTGFVNRKRLSRILAVGETTVSKLPITALGRVLEKSPESKLRVIQLIMMWIHRVLLVALLSFLRIDGSALMAMKRVFASDELSERVRGDSIVSAETGSQRRSIHSFTPFKISMSDTETSKNLESISPDGDFRWGLKTLKSKLKLEDSYPLEKRLKYLKIPPSTLILRATETDSPLLFVVVGCLSAWIKEPEDDSSENTMEAFTVNRGEMFSGLALLSGEPMLFTVESKGPTKVLAIHREDFGEMLRERPEIVTPLAHAVITRLSPFVRLIDFALDWVHLDAGQVMYRQGEEARNIFIVLAGRIRSLLSKGDKTEAMRDYSRGDMIGIIEVYCKIPRYATMMAVRDSEVVRVPLLLLDFLVAHHPSMVTRLIKYLSKSMATAFHTRAQLVNRGLTHSPGAPETMTTIAVVPTDKYSPVDSFSVELEFALRNICRTVRISSEDVRHVDARENGRV